MNFTKTMFAAAIGSVGIMGAMSAHAFTLNTGDILSISAGAQATSAFGSPTALATGSWFAMDTAKPISVIAPTEQVLLSEGTQGIVIGSYTTPGAFHSGNPLATDTGPVVDSWSFNGSTGTNFFNAAQGAAPTGGTTTGINMSSWDVAWQTTSSFNMGQGTWTPGNCAAAGMACSGYAAGTAVFNWDGVYGSTYTLDYTAIVPTGAFTGTQYAVHLTGVVTAAALVPEASTYGMMLAGLGLVGFAVRRRRIS